MPKLLEVSRMTDADLWKHLHRCLGELRNARIGELTYMERRGLAHRAAECATELQLRGTQLSAF